MHTNNISDELPIDLLTHNFNSRSFLMFLRRQNEKHKELSRSEHDRYHPIKYCSLDNSRGFARINKHDYSSLNLFVQSNSSSCNVIINTDDLSKKLLKENLSIVHRRWQKSKLSFSSKIKSIQSDLNSQANISLKKATYECQEALFRWLSKNRLK